MKNVILLAAIFAASGSARAQELPGGIVTGGGEAKVSATISLAPVMHLQLTPGTDQVALALKSASDYEKGIEMFVKNQVRVFAIGSRYSLMGEASVPKEQESLFEVFRLKVGGKLTLYSLRPNEKTLLHDSGPPVGQEELDALYAITPLDAQNDQAFRDLLGKDGSPRKYSINLTYTIVPQ